MPTRYRGREEERALDAHVKPARAAAAPRAAATRDAPARPCRAFGRAAAVRA